MTQVVAVEDLVHHIADYLSRVVHGGERLIVVKDEQPVAELSPAAPALRLADLPDVFALLPHLSPDELAGFAEDLEAARHALDAHGMVDHW